MPPAWGFPGVGLTTGGAVIYLWMAPYGQPRLSCYSPGLFLCALLSRTQRPKIYSSESVEISLDGGQEAVPWPASLGKHALLFT